MAKINQCQNKTKQTKVQTMCIILGGYGIDFIYGGIFVTACDMQTYWSHIKI